MLHICDSSPIVLTSGSQLEIEILANSINSVNAQLRDLEKRSEAMALNIFKAIDFRMLSGLLGESLVTTLAVQNPHLKRNPNIDGYPDLMDISQSKFLDDTLVWEKNDFGRFIKYPYGGIEIKNTFGTKKSKSVLHPGDKRITKINNKPDWKAHHKYTNHLLALLSDFIDGCPQIVAALYSDQLLESDWTDKQNPKKNSTMTSFSVIKPSGWLKLLSGLKVCRGEPEYLKYFGVNL